MRRSLGAILYKNPSAPVEQRVEDLLARMTLEEKVAQITAVWARKSELFNAAGQFDPDKRRRLFPAGIGQFSRPNDRKGPSSPLEQPFRDERQTVALVNAIQRDAINNTRLAYQCFSTRRACMDMPPGGDQLSAGNRLGQLLGSTITDARIHRRRT